MTRGHNYAALLDSTVASGGNPQTMPLIVLSSIEPTKWVPNERFDSCQVCTKLFGIFRRKHHCRSCGALVCQPCSPDKEYVQGYKDTRVRICRNCAATKQKRQDELKTQNIFISATGSRTQSRRGN